MTVTSAEATLVAPAIRTAFFGGLGIGWRPRAGQVRGFAAISMMACVIGLGVGVLVARSALRAAPGPSGRGSASWARRPVYAAWNRISSGWPQRVWLPRSS